MKLIIGLGNPGTEYAHTRHNVGFDALAYFAKKHKISLDRKQGDARVGQGEIQGVPVILARPYTFMNRSGRAVKALKDKYNIDLADIVVIHDEMDLPLGKIRIRLNGSSAGHKGIDSIIAATGSKDFIHIRIGIGHPENGEEESRENDDVMDHVLTRFSPDEKKVMDEIVTRISEALLVIMTEGLDAAMNKFNRPAQVEKAEGGGEKR